MWTSLCINKEISCRIVPQMVPAAVWRCRVRGPQTAFELSGRQKLTRDHSNPLTCLWDTANQRLFGKKTIPILPDLLEV